MGAPPPRVVAAAAPPPLSADNTADYKINGQPERDLQGTEGVRTQALTEQEIVVGADSEQTPVAPATARELRRLLLEQASRDALEAKAQKLSKKDRKAAAAEELRRIKEAERQQKSSRNAGLESDSGSEPTLASQE